MSYFIVDNFVRYKFCTTLGDNKNNDKNLFLFVCFCWEEKLFYFIQQDYRKKGNFTQLNR